MTPPPDPLAVHIGAREIYDELKSVGAKVDRLVDAHESLRAVDADHETRLRAVERARWPLPSLAALISLAALVVGILSLTSKG